MDLKTPTKKVEPFILDDRQKSYSPESDEEEQEEQSSEVEEYRKRYVGDVDLPEGVYKSRFHFFFHRVSPTPFIDQEPLLKESRHRFVLFPIQYHEVCGLTCII